MSSTDADLQTRAAPLARELLAPSVERALEQIAGGVLRSRRFGLRLWDGSELAPTADAAKQPTILVRDPVALAYIATEPNEIGLARAWAVGALDLVGELDDVFEIGEQMPHPRLSALDKLRVLITVWRLAGVQVLRAPELPSTEIARRVGRRHSRRRDRQAVRHHYDVPSDFHRLVIGPSMVYSCAYFAERSDSLEAAQAQKLDLICRKLRLKPGDRLLDVGCGWGSLVLHAARHYGVSAVGVTLSEPQAAHAREAVRQAGRDLAGRCEIRVADYRDVHDGPFDAIASVGMYEHVGLAQLGRYVGTLHDLLRPGGLFLNHGIARVAPLQGQGSRFIDRFIFPDGELHPVGELVRALEHNHLEVRDVESLREHYGLTLRHWIANLETHRDQAVAIAGAERERIWRIYLTASARAFEHGVLSIFQVLSVRSGRHHRLPLTREHLAFDPSSRSAGAGDIDDGDEARLEMSRSD